MNVLDFNLGNQDKQNLISAGWMSVCEAYGRYLPVPEALLELPEPTPEPEKNWIIPVQSVKKPGLCA